MPPNELNVTKRRACKQLVRAGRCYQAGRLTGGDQEGVISEGRRPSAAGGRQCKDRGRGGSLTPPADKISPSGGHPRRWHTIKMEGPIHPEYN